MKTVRKLCQATLALVLSISMVFSTGITNVFADGLTTEQQTEQNGFISDLNTNINTYKTGMQKLEANGYNFATIDDALSDTSTVSTEDKTSIQALKDLSTRAGILNNVLETTITTPSDEAIASVVNAVNDTNIGLSLVQEYLRIVPNHELELVLSNKAVTVKINNTEVEANGSISVDNSFVHDVEVVATPKVSGANVQITKSWATTNVLAIGNNTVTVTVTALDNSTQDYTYTVVRGSRAADIQGFLDDFTNLLTSENIDKYIQALEITRNNGATYPGELLNQASSNLTTEEIALLNEFDDFLYYADDAADIIDDFDNLVNYSVITAEERTTIENTYNDNLRTALTTLAQTNFDNTRLLINDEDYAELFEAAGVYAASENISNANDINVIINGLEMTSDTIYVGYELTNVDVEVEGADLANISIDNPSELVVGNNTVTVTITPLHGDPVVKTYTVVRLTEDADKGDGYDEVKSTPAAAEPMVSTPDEEKTTSTYVASSKTKDTTTESKDKKEVKKEKKFDEEVEEDKGLNGITILLIVIGIALIGFGIYMLFGDKDDEIPTVKTKPTNNNKKPNKKNKR